LGYEGQLACRPDVESFEKRVLFVWPVGRKAGWGGHHIRKRLDLSSGGDNDAAADSQLL
jgi:hypothetical protein